jgi:hypothetical protein
MEKLQRSMTVYVKSLSKRKEDDDKEKILPVAYLSQTMIHHGEDFEPDSDFGNCLIGECDGHLRTNLKSNKELQVWAGPTRELQDSRRHMLLTLPMGGSSLWSALCL